MRGDSAKSDEKSISSLLVPDHHVHSEWSWDAKSGSMEGSCRRALELGLPSIAFTEHADWSRGASMVVDIYGYLECVERCRRAFPELRILSGVELGEPHRHPDVAATLVESLAPDRVLGSIHFFEYGGRSADASEPGFLVADRVSDMFRTYLGEVQALLESNASFDVLAHLGYPKRYWPKASNFEEKAFEEEYRELLRTAGQRDVVLEINTSKGVLRHMCPGPMVVKWWREEAGKAVSFASDAHTSGGVAAGFDIAVVVAEAAGFRPQADPNAFWIAG